MSLTTAIKRSWREGYREQEKPDVSASPVDGGDPGRDAECKLGPSDSTTGKASEKRAGGMFSPESVKRARGYWLVFLLVLNLALWAGVGWVVWRLVAPLRVFFG